ncbi:PepSY domain-containing protein [Lysinibacillus sp. NPDC097287]|uniref:PepSY domain-containing protein n=1 Tax=Lysinibacillus sp. NPDC097287 TaxID=3364144 RepID=UPI0037FE8662
MKKIILIPALVGVLGIGAVIGSTSLLSGNAQENKVLTMQEIEKKALAIVNGTVTDIEFDKERTGDVYEVEIITATEEHDLKFDAYTGKLLSQKKEALDDDDDDDRNMQVENNTAKKITKEQAIERTLSKVDGTVTKVELDDDVYEIEIVDGQFGYDVEIHANTGEIVEFEQDIED